MTGQKLSSSHKYNNSFCSLLSGNCKKYSVSGYILMYTVCFSLLTLTIYSLFAIRGKSFVWNPDGMTQHYVALIYIGKWLRELLSNIFIEHTFAIPLWDFNIGVGGDILTTFNYYGLGDPLCCLAVFFSEENIIYLYSALIIIRLYLSGLFFSFYCFRMKQTGIEVMLGAFAYVYCGYGLFAGVRHPFFLVPMMMLPLMLTGAERILDGESPVLFIASVFLSFSINFYFSYTLIVLTVIYVAVRFFTQKHESKFKTLFKTIGKFLLAVIIGIMMAAVLLLPVIIVFLNSSRSEIVNKTPLLYDATYYLRLYTSFCGYISPGSWTVTGFIPVTLISAMLLFKRKGEHTYLKILFCIFTLMLVIPFFGTALNGFAYLANRWTWAYALLMAFIFVVMFKHLSELERNEKIFLFVIVTVYVVSCYLLRGKKVNTSSMAQWAILAVLMLILVFGGKVFGKWHKKIATSLVCLLCVVSIFVNSYYCYYSQTMNYIDEFIDIDDAYSLIDDSVSSELSADMQEDFSRYEQVPNRKVRNQSVIDGSHGIAYYWSLTDNYISDYLRDNQAVTAVAHDYMHMNRKTFIDELFSVKYFFAPTEDTVVPYGYEYQRTVDTAEGEFNVYENQYALPLGFGYSDYITRDEYNSLTAAEKQEALVSNILLEEDIQGYEKSTYTLSSEILDADIVCSEGVSVEGDRIIVTKHKGSITLNFEPASNCELYVDIRGIYCEDELWASDIKKLNGEWDGLSTEQKLKYVKKDFLSRDAKVYVVRTGTDDCSYNTDIATPYYQFYDGIHDILANVGYSDAERSSVTISFDDAGIYSFDSINIIKQPMENYTECVAERSENILKDVEIIDNGFKGTANLSESQLMFFSVPYSKGFEAHVDGEKAEILRANTWGMALDLDEGEHTIEFRYCTRGLKAGAVISLIGFALFTGVIVYYNSKKRKSKTE